MKMVATSDRSKKRVIKGFNKEGACNVEQV